MEQSPLFKKILLVITPKPGGWFWRWINFCKNHRLGCGIFIFLFSFIVSFSYIKLFSAPKYFPTQDIIHIKDGASLRSLSRYLVENKIIRSRVVFETFLIMLGDEKSIDAGEYFFEKKLSVFEVARRISKGDRHLAKVSVTIPEGFTNEEIAEAFASKLTEFNSENFLALAKEKEGYLFPDTYFFLSGDDEEDVILSMSNSYEKKIAPIREEIQAISKTEREIITMASIIEGEARGNEDREIISGILWKRLKIKMPLQVDVAPTTYKEKGLPENPISNPGIKSIKAAIHPKSSPYLYYLHDKDGNVHYSSTYRGHLANINIYLR